MEYRDPLCEKPDILSRPGKSHGQLQKHGSYLVINSLVGPSLPLNQGRTMMDQNSNLNLQVVQGDFPIKYGPKTLKHPFKIQWEIHFFTFSNTDRNAPKNKLEQNYGYSHFKSAFKIHFRLREVVKLKKSKYAYLCISSLTPSRSQKLILNSLCQQQE